MNITYTLKEKKLSENDDISYACVLKEVQSIEQKSDSFVAMELDYQTNYTLKELEMIAGYYLIKRSRRKKRQFVKELVEFENNIENEEIVFRRKLMWSYLDELLEDNYLRKFVVLN